jgi:hypothetical protein
MRRAAACLALLLALACPCPAAGPLPPSLAGTWRLTWGPARGTATLSADGGWACRLDTGAAYEGSWQLRGGTLIVIERETGGGWLRYTITLDGSRAGRIRSGKTDCGRFALEAP